MKNRLKLCSVSIKGFKSISAKGQTIEFGDITVLIGSNTAGKSNLVSFFKMLNYMMTGALQIYIGEQGYANTLLHFGADNTPQIKADYRQFNTQIDRLIHSLAGVNPETINESSQTAPSKRSIGIIPEYDDDKATVGSILLDAIGLHNLRSSCRHFNEWVTNLENL
jgi:predicted ATPase